MTLRICIDGGTAVVSSAVEPLDPHPMRTGTLRARGALLTWDATVPGTCLPHADVHDPAEAAEWAAEIYGEPVAAAVRDSTEGRFPARPDAALCGAAQRLAHLRWARHWWPAGVSIPALHPAILAAETAVAAHRVARLLDDPTDLDQALRDAADAPAALAALPNRFRAEAAELHATLVSLAAARGIALAPQPAHSEPAGTACGSRPADDDTDPDAATRIDHGIVAVRWADVPGQTVAADDDAHWSLHRVDGLLELSISVPAVSGAEASLMARFGPTHLSIDLPLVRAHGAFVARSAVAASVASLPEAERTLWVRDPQLSTEPGDDESEDDRDDVRNRAVARLDDPAASLAERAAAR